MKYINYLTVAVDYGRIRRWGYAGRIRLNALHKIVVHHYILHLIHCVNCSIISDISIDNYALCHIVNNVLVSFKVANIRRKTEGHCQRLEGKKSRRTLDGLWVGRREHERGGLSCKKGGEGWAGEVGAVTRRASLSVASESQARRRRGNVEEEGEL